MTPTLPISRDHAPRPALTHTVSHHWFRRTARAHAKHLRAARRARHRHALTSRPVRVERRRHHPVILGLITLALLGLAVLVILDV